MALIFQDAFRSLQQFLRQPRAGQRPKTASGHELPRKPKSTIQNDVRRSSRRKLSLCLVARAEGVGGRRRHSPFGQQAAAHLRQQSHTCVGARVLGGDCCGATCMPEAFWPSPATGSMYTCSARQSRSDLTYQSLSHIVPAKRVAHCRPTCGMSQPPQKHDVSHD